MNNRCKCTYLQMNACIKNQENFLTIRNSDAGQSNGTSLFRQKQNVYIFTSPDVGFHKHILEEMLTQQHLHHKLNSSTTSIKIARDKFTVSTTKSWRPRSSKVCKIRTMLGASFAPPLPTPPNSCKKLVTVVRRSFCMQGMLAQAAVMSIWCSGRKTLADMSKT